MWRMIKGLLFLLLIGFIGLVGYAYLGNLEPVQSEVVRPVDLDAE